MLKEYELEEYKEVVDACLRGDMVSIEEAIQTNMDFFIHSGVFPFLERLRLVTLRNYVKRVTMAINATPEL